MSGSDLGRSSVQIQGALRAGDRDEVLPLGCELMGLAQGGGGKGARRGWDIRTLEDLRACLALGSGELGAVRGTEVGG